MIIRLMNSLLWMSSLGLVLLGYGVLIEPSRLVVRNIDFVSDKYSGPDIRVALVTDIHINSVHVPPRRVLDIVDAVNAEAPHLVFLPGDFVAGHDKAVDRTETFNENIKLGLSYLQNLSVPSFATIGNHDAWWDAEGVAENLEAAGIRVLKNEAVVFSGLCLVGLSDHLTGTPERSAYDTCPETSKPLVFTHSPDAWYAFRSDTVLAFAGHTHGGQVNLPIIGRRVNAISLGPEYSYGFSTIAGVDLFVSAGVGTSMLPIRFRAPPEIVVITLREQE